jgi:excisionase family DNA binding protein
VTRVRLADLADLPPTLTVPETAAILGIGRNLAYEAIRRGAFPVTVLRIGRRELISTSALLAYLETGE